MDKSYLNNIGGNNMIDFVLNEVQESSLDIILKGDLDIESTEVVENLLPSLEKYKAININFEKVPFVDSSGMGLLLHVVQSLSEKGVKVMISNVKEDVFIVFELLQIPEILGKDVFV
jgi:anti-anti-sigma factor